MRFRREVRERPGQQPVGGIPGVEQWDAVLVEGACEQCMWIGFLERNLEFHDNLPDTCDAYAIDSSERSDRYRNDANP